MYPQGSQRQLPAPQPAASTEIQPVPEYRHHEQRDGHTQGVDHAEERPDAPPSQGRDFLRWGFWLGQASHLLLKIFAFA